MASILIASVPIHGHVAPLLAVARHFVARGDRVRVLTGARFADAVRGTGAEHLRLPDEADFDDRLDLNQRFPGRAALSGAQAIAFDVAELFARPQRAQHDAVMQLHARDPVDALLVDPAFAGAALVTGHPRARRPAVVMCGVLPLSLSSRDTAPFGMGLAPLPGLVGRARNALLAALAGRLLAGAQRDAGQAYRTLHGTDMPVPLLDWARRAEAIAQFSVPAFEYPRSDAPGNLHFIGPVAPIAPPGALPDWWHELDDGPPVVHVTQGTIANKDFRQLVQPTLEALADEDVQVVVATGGRPLSTLPRLPANARAAEYLPYDRLLPRTRVFVTNGGYGGVQHALRHGVPVVACGGQEDKPEVGARVAWSGVGLRLRATSPRPRDIRRAVLTALHEPRHRRAAAAMAERMAASPGLPGLATIVDGAIG